MAKSTKKKVTVVSEHPLHVPISEKNPTGVTIRDRHLRRLNGTYLDVAEIASVFKNYDRKNLMYPTSGRLNKYKNADKYDETIGSIMNFSKNSLIHYILLFSVCGCSTSSFELLKQDENAAELRVTPDRVLIECEHQPDHDTKGAYGFLIHILDNENTVISAVQTNVLDKEGCLRRIQKIGKILNTGKIIYVGGMGYLTKPKRKEERRHTFPNIGTFHDNGHTLQFIVIANEQGLCYDAYSGDEDPCPREPFSKKNLK